MPKHLLLIKFLQKYYPCSTELNSQKLGLFPLLTVGNLSGFSSGFLENLRLILLAAFS